MCNINEYIANYSKNNSKMYQKYTDAFNLMADFLSNQVKYDTARGLVYIREECFADEKEQHNNYLPPVSF
jgi:hypothetical protein